MYAIALGIHSVLRWLLLLGLIAPIVMSVQGLLRGRQYRNADGIALKIATGLAHSQLLLGLCLYAVFSPLTGHFLATGKLGSGGIFENQILFFAVYHSAMMFLSIFVMSIGGSMVRKAKDAAAKFRITLWCYSVALLIVLAAIPWFRNFLPQF